MTDRVLVTGISGFIGSHIALRLAQKGYAVRGTVRNKVKGERIIDAFVAAGAHKDSFELVEADLASDDGWRDAVKDCRYIQHIASPLPNHSPSDREALVPEARAGAQRVLENGFSAGAERIVMTSSIAAMIGQPGKKKHFMITEDAWSDPEWKDLTAYPVSKTRAEISAWAYAKAQNVEGKLTVINPALVFGPDSFGNGGASLGLIKALMHGKMPRMPKLAYPIIDVRDCAAIHVAAMTQDKAAGRRLIAAGQTLWLSEIAKILKAEFPNNDQLPNNEVPNWLVKISTLFDDRSKDVLGDLGVFHEADAGYVTTLTHVVPRPAKEAILEAARTFC